MHFYYKTKPFCSMCGPHGTIPEPIMSPQGLSEIYSVGECRILSMRRRGPFRICGDRNGVNLFHFLKFLLA
ncbi:MAG: hypothetical protein JWR09_489 [Mucilaginibacter sp.]|nr:hypothetical protein [Mucilaginibacter sp.]